MNLPHNRSDRARTKLTRDSTSTHCPYCLQPLKSCVRACGIPVLLSRLQQPISSGGVGQNFAGQLNATKFCSCGKFQRHNAMQGLWNVVSCTPAARTMRDPRWGTAAADSPLFRSTAAAGAQASGQ